MPTRSDAPSHVAVKRRHSRPWNKPPFQTRAEIERRIFHGGLSEAARELWDCLFLTISETEEVLSDVKENSSYSFLLPRAVQAAHTGARRSELVRSTHNASHDLHDAP